MKLMRGSDNSAKTFHRVLSTVLVGVFVLSSPQSIYGLPAGPLSAPTPEPSEPVSPQRESEIPGVHAAQLPAAPAEDTENVTPKLQFKPISDVAVNAGNLVTFTLEAVSAGEQEITFEILDAPEGVSIEENRFRWQPAGDVVGQHKLVVKASDGIDSIEQIVTFFFLPDSGVSAPAVRATVRRRDSKSALVLASENGWIVVIPSTRGAVRKSPAKSADELKREGELEDADFRIGKGEAKNGFGTNVEIAPGTGAVGIGAFPGIFPSTSTPGIVTPPAGGGTPPSTSTDDDTTPVAPPEEPVETPPEPPAPPEPPPIDLDQLLRLLRGDRPGINTSPIGSSPAHNTFTDATLDAGLGNAFARGVAFDDADGNGVLDLYLATPYRDLEDSFNIQFEPDPNQRNILFSGDDSGDEITYGDVTDARDASIRPLDDPDLVLEMPQGTFFGDFDNDNDRDIFMPNFERPNVLLASQGPALPFLNRSDPAGIDDAGDAHGATLADFNLDGRLDIFVVNGIDANRMYMNQGGGTFNDEAPALGVTSAGVSSAAVAFDADLDGDSDLLVTNIGEPNQLFRNDLIPGGVFGFTDVAAQAGVAGSDFPIGLEAGDLDNDGKPELFIADLIGGSSVLYQNTSAGGDLSFTDRTATLEAALGAALPSPSGAAFFDIHNDGLMDIYVITENASNVMFKNNGFFSFTEVTEAEVVFGPDFTDSVATLDYNDDGLTDIFVASTPSLLYKNITENNFHWINVDLAPVSGTINRDAIGAVVRVDLGNGTVRTQEVSGGTGHAQDDRILHFGLGDVTEAASITVIWPTRPARSTVLVSDTSDLTADQTIVISDSGSPFFIETPAEPVPAGRGLEDSFELRVIDPDGDAINMDVAFDEPALFDAFHLEKTGDDAENGAEIWTFTYTPAANPNTSADAALTFTAHDGNGAEPAVETVDMDIFAREDFNIAPVFGQNSIIPTDPIAVVEGQAMADLVRIEAIDGDVYETGILEATVSVDPAVPIGGIPVVTEIEPLQITASGKSRILALAWTPALGTGGVFPGSVIYQVTVTLSDGIETTSRTFPVQVFAAAFNQAPEWKAGEPAGVFEAAVGETLDPAISLTDALDPASLDAGETLTFNVAEVRDSDQNPVAVTGLVNITGGQFTFTPSGEDFNAAGGNPLTFFFSVTDNVLGRIPNISDGTPITILGGNVDPPLWIGDAFPVDAQVAVGGEVTLNLLAETGGVLDLVDYDGFLTDLVFDMADVGLRDADITNGVFSYRPVLGEAGPQTFTLTVHDTITPASVDNHVFPVTVSVIIGWDNAALGEAIAAELPLVAGESTLNLTLTDFVTPSGLAELNFSFHAAADPVFTADMISGDVLTFSPAADLAGTNPELKLDVMQGVGGTPAASDVFAIVIASDFLFKDMSTDITAGDGLGYFGEGPAPSANRIIISDFIADTMGTLPHNPARDANGLEDLLTLSPGGNAIVPHGLFTPNPGDLSDLEYQSFPEFSFGPDGMSGFASADFDNNGLEDLYVAVSDGENRIFENTGVAENPVALVEHTGSEDDGVGNGAITADIDNDGRIDIYVLNDGPNVLLRNTSVPGAISFVDITAVTGTAGSDRNTLAAAFIDANEDGLVDLFLVHDDGDNELLVNTSPDAVTPFLLAPEAAGLNHTGVTGDRALAVPRNDLKIFVLNADPSLVQLLQPDPGQDPVELDGSGVFIRPFVDVFADSGIDLTSLASDSLRDAAFGDFDNDRDQDILIAPRDGEILIFNAEPDGVYHRAAATGMILNGIDALESVAVTDINQDGLLDVLAAGLESQVFINMSDDALGRHYLQLSLEGDPLVGGTATDALGGIVTIFPLGLNHDQVSLRLADGTGASKGSNVLHFGLGNITDIASILIAWPSGSVQEINDLDDVKVDQRYRVFEENTGTAASEITVQLKNVTDDSTASQLHFTPTPQDIFVSGEQYMEVTFLLGAPNRMLSIFTQNQSDGPAYTGPYTTVDDEDRPLRGSGMIGTLDHSQNAPIFWQVYRDVQPGGVVFQDDPALLGVLQGAVLDTGYPGFSLDPTEFPQDFVHTELAHIDPSELPGSRGQFSMFTADGDRTFDETVLNTTHVYFAADFERAEAQDYSADIKVIVSETTP